MKFKVAKSELLQGLQRVQNIAGGRSTLPILSNVLIAAEKTGLRLSTTDLDVSVRCRVPAEVAKTGTTTLPAKRLFGIVRELQEGDIEVEVDDKDVASVTSGASFFKINGLSEDEFPPLPEAEGKYCYRLDRGAFREMLRKTAYAASRDESRVVLNGVLLSFRGGKLTVVATDGRRLALTEAEVEVAKDAEADLILPTKAVEELLHILGDAGQLSIYPKDKLVVFQFDEIVLISKLIDGTYPNYRQVIPSQCEERVTVERESLLTALRRVSLVTTDKSNATRLTFAKNRLTIAVTTPEVGEARESVPIKYGGKEIAVAFNPEYMMDPLRSLTSDEVFLELTDELSPGVIKCEIPFVYVLMPMRLT